MSTSDKPSARQLAARELFAQRARAGEFKHKAGARRSNPSAGTVILERGKTPEGLPVRLQARRGAFDVIRYSGVTWRYVDKGVTEARARNTFALLIGPMNNPSKPDPLLTRARRLYNAYKTTTPEYRELARQLGYENSGELNSRFSHERGAKYRQTNPAADDGLTLSVKTAKGPRWVSDVEPGGRIVFGAQRIALRMSAERAANVKARIEASGHRVEVHGMEAHDNPRRRSPPRSRKQDLAIALDEQRAGHPRKAGEFFERAARARKANPSATDLPPEAPQPLWISRERGILIAPVYVGPGQWRREGVVLDHYTSSAADARSLAEWAADEFKKRGVPTPVYAVFGLTTVSKKQTRKRSGFTVTTTPGGLQVAYAFK